MKKILVKFTICVLALAPFLARAGGDEVVVIYNKNMPGSEDVAEHYGQERQVPDSQIFGFDLTTNEVMSRHEFRDSLQIPLRKLLEENGLWKIGKARIPTIFGEPEGNGECVVASKIRYAVLCYGVPLKIDSDPNLQEVAPKKMNPKLRTDAASVDSELAWLPLEKTHRPLIGPMLNWVYGTTNASLLDPTNGILLVARLDGPSAEIARSLVDKALEGERDGLWGNGYFDARGLTPTNAMFLGDEWILGAAELWRALGFPTYIDDKPATFSADYPMSEIAVYCGWYDGSVSGPFTLPNVEFMPGAFAYHLHSYSANTIRDPNSNWVGPLLAKGATCTMGCVNEPYLQLTPNVEVFLTRLIASQFTFGEAAWAAQRALSWQTTVVGDPLYCPFGTPPEVMLKRLEDSHSPLVEWPILRAVNLAYVHGRPTDQLITTLKSLPFTTNSPVLMEKLAQFYVIEGKFDAAAETCEQALDLRPTPEERIRLRLALAELLKKEGHIAAARLDYQRILIESPDYPGRATIDDDIAALPTSDSPINK